MDKIVCPYCGEILEGDSDCCPNCNNSLVVECPFCKKEIKAYEKICPYCTSNLVKKDSLGLVNILGFVMSAIWIIISLICIVAFYKYPAMLNARDKNGDSECVMSYYISFCLQYGITVSIPYIISIVKKHRQKFAVTAISINAILMIVFSVCVICIKLAN